MNIEESTRLRLRPWKLDELDDAYEIWGAPEVMAHVGEGKPLSRDGVLNLLEQATLCQEQYGCQHWAVIEKQSDCIVGACGFEPFAAGPELELSFYIKRSHWRQGYALEAARTALDYAFDQLCQVRVLAGAYDCHLISHRILETLGFRSIFKGEWPSNKKSFTRYELCSADRPASER